MSIPAFEHLKVTHHRVSGTINVQHQRLLLPPIVLQTHAEFDRHIDDMAGLVVIDPQDSARLLLFIVRSEIDPLTRVVRKRHFGRSFTLVHKRRIIGTHDPKIRSVVVGGQAREEIDHRAARCGLWPEEPEAEVWLIQTSYAQPHSRFFGVVRPSSTVKAVNSNCS